MTTNHRGQRHEKDFSLMKLFSIEDIIELLQQLNKKHTDELALVTMGERGR